jgi:DNA-binding transcriptional LysR family regulator
MFELKAAAVSLEQARTLVAVVRLGSFGKAAKALHKVPSAVVYSLKTLEDALGVAVLSRVGYRSALTPIGQRVLEHCQKMLESATAIEAVCQLARDGVDPYLRVVFDGLLPAQPILAAARAVGSRWPATRISLFSEFLSDVEARFADESADVMISVIPPAAGLSSMHAPVTLQPLPSVLVAAAGHAVLQIKGPVRLVDLAPHTFLTVHGSDERLQLATAPLEKASVFRLSDFHAKKAALLSGMGYGWMPEYLVKNELARRKLRKINLASNGGRHVFHPRLYSRRESRASDLFVEKLLADSR